MHKIGERIYELRITNNMSQENLADELNVSRQAISKWENSMSIPEIEKIIQISNIFGVSTDYLLKGEEVKISESDSAAETGSFDAEKRKTQKNFGYIFIFAWLMGSILAALYHNSMLFGFMPYLFFVGMCLLFIKKYAVLTILIVTLVLTLVFGGYILVYDIYLLLLFAEIMCVVYLLCRELKDR